jgi:amino acid adenylation domain-containing protein
MRNLYKMQKSFSCYIISRTSLGQSCAIEIIKADHKLLGMITTHQETISWAKQNNIQIIPTIEEFKELKPSKTFDYLFSIVSSKILSNDILEFPRYLAINYHDSPLPKYAGVNTTSWVILNKEKMHSVSWHNRVGTINIGSILKQHLPIRKDDTALSLNLECYTQALESFKELIQDLKQNPLLERTKQDLKGRSYVSKFQKPSNLGFVSWNDYAKDIERQFRALQFGGYPNTLTSFKVLINDQIFIPTEVEIIKTKSKNSPGTIINITNKYIEIATKANNLRFAGFRTTFGELVTVTNISQLLSVDLGYKLSSPSTGVLSTLRKVLEIISPYESFWMDYLLKSKSIYLAIGYGLIRDALSMSTENMTNYHSQSKKRFKTILIPWTKFITDSSSKHKLVLGENDSIFIKKLIAAFIIYLYKLENTVENDNQFSIGFVAPFLQNLSKTLRKFFPESIPLDCSISNTKTISDVVQNIQDEIVKLERHKAYFIDLPVKYKEISGLSTQLAAIVEIDGINNTKIKRNLKFNNAQLIFIINKASKTCTIKVDNNLYNTTKKALINCLPKHFITIAKQVIDNANKKLDEISLLTKKEEKRLLIEGNNTAVEYKDSQNKTITNLFEEQVERTPDNTAVVYEDTQLTYKELNERANGLAHYLKSLGVGPDVLVAIMVERSLEMIISLLGILKAGGAYVPFDPDYPEERLKYMLDDTGTKVLITQMSVVGRNNSSEKLKGLLSFYSGIVVIVDELEAEVSLMSQSSNNPSSTVLSHHLAYVIYTSGSTGKPKGVMVSHGGLYNFLIGINKSILITSSDKFLATTNITFDIAALELYLPFISGSSLVLSTKNLISTPVALVRLLESSNITVMQATPTVWQMLLNYLEQIIDAKVKILCGGESTNPSLIQSLANKGKKVWNLYGPTETTIWSSSKIYSFTDDIKTNVSIGYPISNTQIYILDSNMNPLPALVIGEIYIGGVGLARGYLGRPDLTAERFVPNPFVCEDGDRGGDNGIYSLNNNHFLRIYRTGDLAHLLPDGNIEFLGRIDDQVKIRGSRIELGEIEAVLSSCEGVKQSVVLAKEQLNTEGVPTGNKYLVAYYTKESNSKNTNTEDSAFVSTLHDIYQSQYSSLNINNFKQNTNIWISSYTGKAIDQEDMTEWINETVKRIKMLNPKVVLEIGSGSGLVLFNIIDSCNYYYATDFSSNVIDYTNTVIDKFDYNNKVSTISCLADKIPYHELYKPYDTVIINSVIMHFPNLDYLESVIIEAASHMQGDGQIFIGDVRDYRLLKCFHYLVQKYKHKNVTKADVDYFVQRDKDLVVSPEYFINLKMIIENISYVEVMPRFGEINNEMNNYRYDVIIHIIKNKDKNRGINETEDLIIVDESSFLKILDFEGYLLSNIDIYKNQEIEKKINYLSIKYPNKRIIKDYAEYSELYNNQLITEKDCYNNLLHISQISEIVENNNLKAKFLLDIHDPLYLYILVYKDNSSHSLRKNICVQYATSSTNRNDYSNNPSANLKFIESQFTDKLKEHLSFKLPDYMVPEHYISLDAFPLTTNGKLDKKALPQPKFIKRNNYVAPRNKLEVTICQIWSEVLGLPKDAVGINDTFFSLGGNSILAINLANKIKMELDLNIDMLSVFKFNTVGKLLMHLEYEVVGQIKGENYVF